MDTNVKNKTRKTDVEITKDIINTMFVIAELDVTVDDLTDNKDDWYNQYTMTPEQDATWTDWAIKYLKKHKAWSTAKCRKEFSWLKLAYGLKVIYPKQQECHEG